MKEKFKILAKCVIAAKYLAIYFSAIGVVSIIISLTNGEVNTVLKQIINSYNYITNIFFIPFKILFEKLFDLFDIGITMHRSTKEFLLLTILYVATDAQNAILKGKWAGHIWTGLQRHIFGFIYVLIFSFFYAITNPGIKYFPILAVTYAASIFYLYRITFAVLFSYEMRREGRDFLKSFKARSKHAEHILYCYFSIVLFSLIYSLLYHHNINDYIGLTFVILLKLTLILFHIYYSYIDTVRHFKDSASTAAISENFRSSEFWMYLRQRGNFTYAEYILVVYFVSIGLISMDFIEGYVTLLLNELYKHS